jgi:hypothetical protein
MAVADPSLLLFTTLFIADTILTYIAVVIHGAHEINPINRILLNLSPAAWLIFRFTLLGLVFAFWRYAPGTLKLAIILLYSFVVGLMLGQILYGSLAR